jgi:diguanylate cyclase (GGDEF)-like protein
MDPNTQRSRTLPPLGRTARLHPVTGLLSRQGFADAFECDLALVRRYGMPMAFVKVRISDFTRFDADAGADAADLALLAVSDALHGMFRASDKIGHIGGGEFVISLLDANESDARRLAAEVQQVVADIELMVADKPVSLRADAWMVMAATDASESFASVLQRAGA